MGKTSATFAAYLRNESGITPGCVADFGLDGGVAFGPVNQLLVSMWRVAWEAGLITEEDLEAATCDGPKLTKLIRRLPVAQTLTIKTVWDDLIDPEDDVDPPTVGNERL